ncbi:MAG TPA: protein-S-isoprenylcysteine O-methyltransferase [Chloroflexaceae bacterium]|nr:protein-S-isoprenylcysteine O-methyltransferase [Chloroflexaceae bacterium]
MKQRFATIYFAGVTAETLLRLPYDRRRRKIPKTDQRVSAAERGLLGGLLVGLLVLPMVYSLTSWLDGADYRLGPTARARAGWAGSALLAAAIWLFWRAHRDLGSNWSPSLEIGSGHTLVTRGVYRRIRHPMYASQLLWSIAQILLLPNWVAGWAGLATFLPLYLSRVPNEERMMLDHFGEAYRAYCAETGRLVPRLGP